ncbi:hypothetical protein BD413DRAFT_570382 [Trametes elegans]|nr:hypothetical protein BD413DRAFT_570382 [Trametes elegans]
MGVRSCARRGLTYVSLEIGGWSLRRESGNESADAWVRAGAVINDCVCGRPGPFDDAQLGR